MPAFGIPGPWRSLIGKMVSQATNFLALRLRSGILPAAQGGQPAAGEEIP